MIDTSTKAFFIFVSSNQVLPIVKGHDVRSISKYVDLMVALGFETSKSEFMESLIPGYYIVFDKMGETYYGVMITTRIAMIFDSKRNNMSYLTNFTENEPYCILKVCKPNDKYFRAKDIEFMDVVWSRPKNRIKKSISEIEALLQLEPGTLEIYG